MITTYPLIGNSWIRAWHIKMNETKIIPESRYTEVTKIVENNVVWERWRQIDYEATKQTQWVIYIILIQFFLGEGVEELDWTQ